MADMAFDAERVPTRPTLPGPAGPRPPLTILVLKRGADPAPRRTHSPGLDLAPAWQPAAGDHPVIRDATGVAGIIQEMHFNQLMDGCILSAKL